MCRYIYHLSPYEIVDSLSPRKGKLKKIFSRQPRFFFVFYNNVYRVNVRCFLSTWYHKSLQNTKINGASVASAQRTRAPANLLLLVGETAIGTTNLSDILEICHLDQIHKHRKLDDLESPTSLFLTLRRLMSYIYGATILDVSRSHTTTQHSR